MSPAYIYSTLVSLMLSWCVSSPAFAEAPGVDLSGEINKDFAFQVEYALLLGAKEIRVESSGGNNLWALQVANSLNERKSTQLVVTGKCVSACASLAFATDNVRITKDAFIAVHRTSLGIRYVLEASEFDLREERFEALNLYADEEARLLQKGNRSASFFEQAMRETRSNCYQELVTTKDGLVLGYKSRPDAHYWMPDKETFNQYRGIDVSGQWPSRRDWVSNKKALDFIKKYKVIMTKSPDELTETPIKEFGKCEN
ncbi:hypothetical protein [Henriciella sp.]|uniref:hypothetical protein n=1 Tax=Henriciella sp. TaxID=1968823 RepID=UPI002627CFD1|nr:hypothetical protein [Henriciella sp.]